VEIDLTGLVLPEKVETVHTSDDGRFGQFVVEPLERGYGHTLGNSVRRVLLSSLRGAAVWAFRMPGVVHEHQTVEGVVEDVHQVIQNLKSLVVVLDADVDEVTVELEARKAGAVTAGMIKDRAGVRILEPRHHLLTLQEDRDFFLELRIRKGRGVELADQHGIDRSGPVDLVRIDAIYNPVRRANFEVRETRVGQRTDFDRLALEVETDGSISPAEAVAMASRLVIRHMNDLLDLPSGGKKRASSEPGVLISQRVRDLLAQPIEDLAELSVRSRNSLQKENIRTLGELVQRSEEQMLAIENFGKKSLKEIQDFLAAQQLRFGMRLVEGKDGNLYLHGEDESETASQTPQAGEP
jgi:DNA-directed RNA polymerase subunit alpha